MSHLARKQTYNVPYPMDEVHQNSTGRNLYSKAATKSVQGVGKDFQRVPTKMRVIRILLIHTPGLDHKWNLSVMTI